MQKLEILNTRQVEHIRKEIEKQFGARLEKDYVFLLNQKGRLFITNKDISRLDLAGLRVDKYGLYFGELKEGEFRLSLEGAELIGKKARKNILPLDKEEVKKYFLGEDLDKDLGEEKRWLLLKYKKDIIGCAKYKEKKLLNFLPKIHWGEVIV